MKVPFDGRRQSGRYEAALGVALATLAFLSKDNPRLILPECLWLFLLLLGANLAASLAVRLRRTHAAAAALVASFIVVAGIQSQSGGSDSDLWVLFLLPIFSAAILLDGREVAWIAAGAVLANAAGLLAEAGALGPVELFALALKTIILTGAAAGTWSLARSERAASVKAAAQRGEIARLESVVSLASGSAGAVHDLGAPLTVILGYASLWGEEKDLPPALRDDLARIERAAGYCRDLVQSLLNRGPSERIRGATEIVESALLLCESVVRARGVEISRDYAPEQLRVRATGKELERVLVNLVGNAVKARPGRIAVTVARRGARVVVAVDDDGPGVPPELLPRLFTPFTTSSAGKGGVGLGLYLCREIARRHGGDLVAGRSPLGGARFELSLPGMSVAETIPS